MVLSTLCVSYTQTYAYIYIYCLQFERSGMVLMSHIREASKITVNSSYFHPAHQHYTDEAHKAETVPSVVIYIYIYILCS
jgi:hypothetical protein